MPDKDESTVPAQGRRASRSRPPVAGQRRWWALLVLCLVQFVLVADVTVVNVALPRIQDDLGFSPAGLVWVVDGYILMAGGLLLLGGRLADVFGRLRLFLLGVCIFGTASAVCAAALAPAMLVSARFVQGAGEALAAPASLGLIVLIFHDPRERMRAVGAWGGVSGLAGVTGVALSGALTHLASWRWTFAINVPIAVFAMLVLPRLVTESRTVGRRARLGFTGAVTATGGLVAIVYALLTAASQPWGSPQVLLPMLGGVGLLAVTVGVEAWSSAPLIPLRFFTDRTRVVANITGLFFLAAFISYFYLMTLFQQQVLGFSPFEGGLAFVPFGISMAAGILLGTALMPRLGVRPLTAVGFFGVAVGLLLTSGIHGETSYAVGVLPGMLVVGGFNGLFVPTMNNAALHRVSGQDAGLASGVQQALQQVGGALGLACLVTLALRHAADLNDHGVAPDVAATDGYVLSFRIAAVLVAVCGVLVLLLFERVSPLPRNALTEQSNDRVPR